jgi:hypothetical protein
MMAEEEKRLSDGGESSGRLDQIEQKLHLLAQHHDRLSQDHEALRKLTVEDLIGGMHAQHKQNMREGRKAELKEKYGPIMDRHIEILKSITPEHYDHWGTLADHTEGMHPGDVDAHVKAISDGLHEKWKHISETHGKGSETQKKEEGENEPHAPYEGSLKKEAETSDTGNLENPKGEEKKIVDGE